MIRLKTIEGAEDGKERPATKEEIEIILTRREMSIDRYRAYLKKLYNNQAEPNDYDYMQINNVWYKITWRK